MATYTAIYEITPNAKFFSEESFLNEIKPAVNIISTLSESFGGCKPKIEIISKAAVNLSKKFFLYRRFLIIHLLSTVYITENAKQVLINYTTIFKIMQSIP